MEIENSNINNDQTKINDDESNNLLSKISNYTNYVEFEKSKEIVFKNYIPKNNDFKVNKISFFSEVNHTERIISKQMKKSVKEFLKLDKNNFELIPQNQDADLKKNLEKKMKNLDKKTEIALNELILLNKK